MLQLQFRRPSSMEIELHVQVMSVWFALSLTSLFLNKLHIQEKLNWGSNGCIYKRVRIPARSYSYKRHHLSCCWFVGKRGCSCSLPSWASPVCHLSSRHVHSTSQTSQACGLAIGIPLRVYTVTFCSNVYSTNGHLLAFIVLCYTHAFTSDPIKLFVSFALFLIVSYSITQFFRFRYQ